MPRAARSQTVTPTRTGPRLVRKSVRTPSPQTTVSLRDRITIRAYELFLEEGGQHGRHISHWLSAEKEVLDTQAPAPPSRKVAGARARVAKA
jgi:hypothetical protein